MARKTTTLRVHQVAKQLGVSSKDIVAKCADEGIPDITNHMSAVSAGLAATVREWFDEAGGGTVTAVETAAKVDVSKARAKAKKKPVRKTRKKASDAAASEEQPAKAHDAPPPPGDAESPKEKVLPVGRRLEQPTKAKLTGPKLIRVEEAEPPRAPRRPPQRPANVGGGGVTPGDAGAAPQEADRGSRRNKRRSTTQPGERRTRTGQPESEKRDSNWRKQDLLERENRLKRAGGFFRQARRDNLKRSNTTPAIRSKSLAETGGAISVSEPITIKDLSTATGVKASEILRQLLVAGTPATVNDTIESDAAVEIMKGYGIELAVDEFKTAEEQIAESFSQREVTNEQSRSPVVTILGHVDHGKTSLLDRIRDANVAAGEAGGITQATSAFRVPVQSGDSERVVTFIDTPGHEAFTEMRARGAKVTDIVVLVVAADDGVMPQTIESISHSKAAEVALVVALNKMDKAEATDANIQRILGQLAEHELNPVEWGGGTEVIRTSATEGEGIQELLEMLDYQADLLELKADFDGPAEGSVIEAHIAEGKGPVVSLLVQQGNLSKGDFVVAGRGYGRVRALYDEHGAQIDAAQPSTPVAVAGLSELPDAGDKFYVVSSLKEAEASARERTAQEREMGLTRERITLDNIFDHLASADRRELPVIVKGDVQGSIETLRSVLAKIGDDDACVSIKHATVGGINDSDVNLAEACEAIIVGFNVTSSAAARRLAEDKRVEIRYYDVIYDLTDDLTKALEGLLDPEIKLEVLGHAEVKEVFKVSKVGMVAGCYVTDGVVERNAQIRVTREGIVVESDRRLDQLRRFKDDAKEVRAGQECGMRVDGYDDIKPGDVIECYKTLEVKRTF